MNPKLLSASFCQGKSEIASQTSETYFKLRITPKIAAGHPGEIFLQSDGALDQVKNFVIWFAV